MKWGGDNVIDERIIIVIAIVVGIILVLLSFLYPFQFQGFILAGIGLIMFLAMLYYYVERSK